MANYTIIGGDQKEYGPITADDVRKWISEGRLNAQSMMKAESDAAFRPLSAFPEFANAFATGAATPDAPPPFNSGSDAHAAALQKVKAPAIALIVTAVVDLLFGFFGLLSRQATLEMYSKMPQFNDPQMQQLLHVVSGPLGIFSYIFQLVATVVVLIAGIRMMALKNYVLVFVGVILAVIPCITPCCGILTLPFGIWALVVLSKPEVKSQFS